MLLEIGAKNFFTKERPSSGKRRGSSLNVLTVLAYRENSGIYCCLQAQCIFPAMYFLYGTPGSKINVFNMATPCLCKSLRGAESEIAEGARPLPSNPSCWVAIYGCKERRGPSCIQRLVLECLPAAPFGNDQWHGS